MGPTGRRAAAVEALAGVDGREARAGEAGLLLPALGLESLDLGKQDVQAIRERRGRAVA